MLQELAEQLSISFDKKVKHQPQGHAEPEPEEDYSHLGSPATPGCEDLVWSPAVLEVM